VYDPVSAQTYFYNMQTNETFWSKPKGLGFEDLRTDYSDMPDTEFDPMHGYAAIHHGKVTGKRLPVSWEEAQGEDGKPYFYNTSTDELSWTLPSLDNNVPIIFMTDRQAVIKMQSCWRRRKARQKALALVRSTYERVVDEENGTEYFYNSKTGESSYAPPSILRGREFEEADEPMTRKRWRAIRREKRRRKEYLVPSQGGAAGTEEEPGGEWEELWSEEAQAIFYFKASTEESLWVTPWKDDPESDDSQEEFGEDWSDSEDEDEDEADGSEQGEGEGEAGEGGPKLDADGMPIESGDSEAETITDSSADEEAPFRERDYPRSQAQLILDDMEDDPEATYANLSNVNAWRLSTRVWDLEFCTELNVSHNRLKRLSSQVPYLEELVKIDCSHNLLRSLPKSMQDMAQMLHLDASHNYIVGFQAHLWKMRSITYIDLSHNRLKDLPNLTGDLTLLKETAEWEVGVGLLSTALTTLHLNDNHMKKWPFQVEMLSRLTTLSIQNNEIENLHPEIGNMFALQTLDAANNMIGELPQSIGTLYQSLTHLDLTNNKMSEVPIKVTDLFKLDKLLLGKNKIRSIPEEIGKLNRLKELDVSDNDLGILPKEVGDMQGLLTFRAGGNRLTAAPPAICGITTLETLDFSRNKIEKMPLSLQRMQGLTSLDMSNNALHSVLPEIGRLKKLAHLDMSSNKLAELPGAISLLRNLTSLDLHSNLLKEMPIEWTLVDDGPLKPLPRLRTLDLANNKLKKLPDDLGNLTTLMNLDVRNNKLKAIPDDCVKLRQLTRFAVAGNDLSARPPLFVDFELTPPNLRSVDLSNNNLLDVEATMRGPLYVAQMHVMQGFKLLEEAGELGPYMDQDGDDDGFGYETDKSGFGSTGGEGDSSDEGGGGKKKKGKKKKKKKLKGKAAKKAAEKAAKKAAAKAPESAKKGLTPAEQAAEDKAAAAKLKADEDAAAAAAAAEALRLRGEQHDKACQDAIWQFEKALEVDEGAMEGVKETDLPPPAAGHGAAPIPCAETGLAPGVTRVGYTAAEGIQQTAIGNRKVKVLGEAHYGLGLAMRRLGLKANENARELRGKAHALWQKIDAADFEVAEPTEEKEKKGPPVNKRAIQQMYEEMRYKYPFPKALNKRMASKQAAAIGVEAASRAAVVAMEAAAAVAALVAAWAAAMAKEKAKAALIIGSTCTLTIADAHVLRVDGEAMKQQEAAGRHLFAALEYLPLRMQAPLYYAQGLVKSEMKLFPQGFGVRGEAVGAFERCTRARQQEEERRARWPLRSCVYTVDPKFAPPPQDIPDEAIAAAAASIAADQVAKAAAQSGAEQADPEVGREALERVAALGKKGKKAKGAEGDEGEEMPASPEDFDADDAEEATRAKKAQELAEAVRRGGAYLPAAREQVVAELSAGQHTQGSLRGAVVMAGQEALVQREAERVGVEKALDDARHVPEAKLKSVQSIEQHRLMYKQKKKLEAMTKRQNREMDEQMDFQRIETKKLKIKCDELFQKQADIIKTLAIEDRNPEDVRQLEEAHAQMKGDLKEEHEVMVVVAVMVMVVVLVMAMMLMLMLMLMLWALSLALALAL
jgi:Leucine-rich repeat (LRR) protein